jgi:limonene 1,2-monooxygenase
MQQPLRFGMFMPPYHNPRRNPSLLLQHDLKLVELLDQLGFHQVWFGEHHSGGYEYIPSPELMIAAASQRTRRIQLCSGVISLPYHHPLMVADRMMFLDHLTMGRVRFGMGPGALVADSQMMGMDYSDLRRRMEEALDAILELLDTPGPVNRKTDWFELVDARLQLRSYTHPRVPLTVASALSPSGPKLAGRYGLGLVSVGGTGDVAKELLANTWSIMTAEAQSHGQTVSRNDWAIVGNIHVAETEKQAREETRYGLQEFMEYRHVVTPMQMIKPGEVPPHDELVDRVNESGYGCIGTPEAAVEYINRLLLQTGGFGTFLLTTHDWADPAATERMCELFAREVMPQFTGHTIAPLGSFLWTKERKEGLSDRFFAGINKAKADYEHERQDQGAGTAR